jgi:methylamine---glutamate N-methyltransferase subunit B
MASAVLNPVATDRAFDLSQTTVRTLNQWLHAELAGSGVRHVEVLNPDGAHSIAVGLDTPVSIDIRGHAGYYCGGMNKLADITVHGNVGWGVAENLMSGSMHPRPRGRPATAACS